MSDSGDDEIVVDSEELTSTMEEHEESNEPDPDRPMYPPIKLSSSVCYFPNISLSLFLLYESLSLLFIW